MKDRKTRAKETKPRKPRAKETKPRKPRAKETKPREPHARNKKPLIDRFESFVMPVPESGCWLWIGTVTAEGYGTIAINCKSVSAHRCSWELYHGPVPNGMLVLHKCDIRSCVNPHHLFLGTQKDNMADMRAKGRQRYTGSVPPGGVGNGAKFGWDTTAKIRALYPSLKIRELSAMFGVGHSTICRIVNWQTWKQPPNEESAHSYGDKRG